MNLKICPSCGKSTMQYLDNEKNNYCFLICPKCRHVDSSDRYRTCQEREIEGYKRYTRAVENIVSWRIEHDDDD